MTDVETTTTTTVAQDTIGNETTGSAEQHDETTVIDPLEAGRADAIKNSHEG